MTTENTEENEEPTDWYFTFGEGHEHPMGYVKINGTFSGARKEIVRRYGARWAFQYGEEDKAEAIDRWGLREVK